MIAFITSTPNFGLSRVPRTLIGTTAPALPLRNSGSIAFNSIDLMPPPAASEIVACILSVPSNSICSLRSPYVPSSFTVAPGIANVSPDSRSAVIPVVDATRCGPVPAEDDPCHELVIVDLDSGATRIVGNARGPVGFTPDGSTIVSYRYRRTPEGDILQHSGSNSSGFKAFGQFNPTKDSGLVLFTNGDGGYQLRSAVIARIGDL